MLDWEALYNASQLAIAASYNFLHNYLDIAYLEWLAWLFWPLLVTFILPVSMLLFLYASAFFLHIYRLRHTLRDAVQRDHWDGARNILAAIWDSQGKIWHGYEVYNFDKIPEQGGAVLVYYHGALPIDMYYLIAHCILHKRINIRPIGDRFLFRVPGFKLLMDVIGVIPGSRSSCNKLLQEGSILSIAPGGVREAQFGDSNYQLMWNARQGFAKIAIDSKVPIIPVFTQNVRESFRSLTLGQSFFRKIYEKYRLPCVPIYGMFPVKLRTFIGEPIPYDPTLDSEQLTMKAHQAIESLIQKHQMIPGNILQALLERFYTPAHCKQE